ncbi:MAG: phosphopyruvate hydratase [Vicinamibacterales bacterium]
MPTIARLSALEILDSRGRPTLRARCELSSGAVGVASIPSGASRGAAEAVELRDGDPERFEGLGCSRAAGHVGGEIHRRLAGCELTGQKDLDEALLVLDGTPDKARLGANAILSTSLAFARAVSIEREIPLHRYFAGLVDQRPPRLPRPIINLFSGGKHAGGHVPIQDVLIVPRGQTISESLAMAYDVFQSAADLGWRKYAARPLRADEGGLSPPFASVEGMLADGAESIQRAGFQVGAEVALAVDVAATHFFDRGMYALGTTRLDSDGMIDRLVSWQREYRLVSIEDGLAEEDWENWPRLAQRLKGEALVVGDDLLCTNPERIRRAIALAAADALLLKVNQIGTVTEAAESLRLARAAGWSITVSARSGDTEDDWLADLAVGWSSDQIKIGSITQSERLAKYNRLLEIEAGTGWPLVDWPAADTRGTRV